MTSPQLSPSRISRLACLGVIACAILGTSCSKGLQQVSGKVLHKGQPIKGAVVTLHPVGNSDPKLQRPSGLTGDDGTFTLSTGQETGAAPGEYTVTVIWLQEAPVTKKMSTEGAPEPIDQLKGRYADPKTSKLTVTIKPGVSQLEPITVE